METPMSAAEWLDYNADQIATEYSRRRELPPGTALTPLPRRRAIGVIRVSRVGKRAGKGERFVSPREQRDSIEAWCRANDAELVAIYEEFDLSAHRTPLLKRRGLLPAIELIERAGADILIVAYFDRMIRNTRVQDEIVTRVEAAGGSVLTLDAGEVSHATANQWFTAQIHGSVAEYHSRITGEKTAKARRDAVARGVPVFPNLPPGYVRGEDGKLVVVPEEEPHIKRVFEMRAGGASLTQCRAYLREHGIERSYRATQTLFTNRLYLGEIHFGKLVNLSAHKPLVDRELWLAADKREPRGRPSTSNRLLARLGVLVCGSCGARLTAASVFNHPQSRGVARQRYAIYRCGMPGDCPKPVTISATLAEEAIVREVRQQLLRDLAAAADQAQQAFKSATLLAMDFPHDAEVQAKVVARRQAAQVAGERYAQIKGMAEPLEVLSATHEWDDLTQDGRRALIKAVLPRVEVRSASTGSDRLWWPGKLGEPPLEA
jgi:DNA invertase Pin-like site-specific DNA recombinase